MQTILCYTHFFGKNCGHVGITGCGTQPRKLAFQHFRNKIVYNFLIWEFPLYVAGGGDLLAVLYGEEKHKYLRPLADI